jgi:photosystem II stability/assembly factor-like uncharacterized protein
MTQRLLIGTRKGTFIAERGPAGYRVRLAGHAGVSVNYVVSDPHDGTLWAALGFGHWGAKLSTSKDGGQSWKDAPAQIKYPEGARYLAPPDPGQDDDGGKRFTLRTATLLKLWAIGFGAPGRVYVGTIPGGLFVSDDGGEHFELNRPLWDHDSRGGNLFIGEGDADGRKTHWFGTPASEGGEFAPGIHSIDVDPRDPERVRVAISTAGVLESRDGGKSWQGKNRGLTNDYLPDPHAEWGHDAHFIQCCPAQPDHVWQQNHCGVFYSADGAANWKKVSQPEQGVHFGFPIVPSDRDGRTAWVVPGVSDQQRMAIGGGLFVARTRDGGESWQQLRQGLPQDNAYDVVYRHALALSGDSLAFGSTTGNLYVSEDGGDHWGVVSHHLPPIYSVRFG